GQLAALPRHPDGHRRGVGLRNLGLPGRLLPGRHAELPHVDHLRDPVDAVRRHCGGRRPRLRPGRRRNVPAGRPRRVGRASGDPGGTPARRRRRTRPGPPARRPGRLCRGGGPVSEPGIDVAGLTVRFEGNVAVDRVSLSAPMGRLTGLIGPNGAGKTTTFNACSGLLRPAEGRIMLFGSDVTRRGPASRARRGLGRTFQRMELFTSMTVAENVALGREARLAGSNPLWQQMATRRQRATVRSATEEALDVCGIGDLADKTVESLSTGQRRLVELARVYAGNFRMLLLDEPSSGLDQAESEHLGQILRSLVDDRGIGILLVEHDMALVMTICDYLYVLDFGRLVFDGTPAETQHSPIVRAAYLGAEDLMEMADLSTGGTGAEGWTDADD